MFRCAAAVNDVNDHMLEMTAEKQKRQGLFSPLTTPFDYLYLALFKKKSLLVNNSFFYNIRVTQTFCSILSQTWNTDIDSSTLYYGNLRVELHCGWQVSRMD